jgi:hypothetical protein
MHGLLDIGIRWDRVGIGVRDIGHPGRMPTRIGQRPDTTVTPITLAIGGVNNRERRIGAEPVRRLPGLGFDLGEDHTNIRVRGG